MAEKSNVNLKGQSIDDVLVAVNNVLGNVNLNDVTAEGAGFEELPEGYYLFEYIKGELTTSKSKGTPMVAIQFKVVEDGTYIDIADNGSETRMKLAKTAGKTKYLYYTLTDDAKVKRFVSDMLKFEGDDQQPLLEAECFTNAELLIDALLVLAGSRVYAQVRHSQDKDGNLSIFTNLISWKRAAKLELA